MTIYQIPLEKIGANPWQTRVGDPAAEYIKELALDIAANGLLQTPIGRIVVEGKAIGNVQIEQHGGAAAYLSDVYPAATLQLAFGHNRLAAYHWLFDLKDNSDIPGDWAKMPVDVRALTDEQMARFAWSENEKRRDVTAIERAKAIQVRLEHFKWTNRECAQELGIDHSTASNLLRLLKLPEDLQQAILDGKISERQAVAVLPVFEMPAGAELDRGYYWDSPQTIANAALAGESSDALRKKVEGLFNHITDLSQATFRLDQLIPEEGGVYCGLCKTCDMRMASRNRCFKHSCFEAKTNFVRREYLKKASKASGYPLSDEHKGGHTSGLPSNPEEFEKILSTKCPNLALLYTQGETKHSIDGHPHAMLVCDKRNDSCTCIKGLRLMGAEARVEHEAHAASPNDTKEGVQLMPLSSVDLEDAARQARKAKAAAIEQLPEFRKRLEEHLYHSAVMGRPGVYYAAIDQYGWPNEKEIASMEPIYRKVARRAANVIVPSDVCSLAELQEMVGRKLKSLNLDLMDAPAEQPETLAVDVEIKEL